MIPAIRFQTEEMYETATKRIREYASTTEGERSFGFGLTNGKDHYKFGPTEVSCDCKRWTITVDSEDFEEEEHLEVMLKMLQKRETKSLEENSK